MHWRGHSTGMQDRAVYDDVVREVCDELAARRDAILAAGVAPDRLVLDPGLGFAKNAPHNWALLARLDALLALGPPVLVGASRKTFLGRIGVAAGGEPRPPLDRDVATAATSVVCATAGVWGVRVHDVAGTRDAFAVLHEVAAHR
jgi:dihydropteroate synthase